MSEPPRGPKKPPPTRPEGFGMSGHKERVPSQASRPRPGRVLVPLAAVLLLTVGAVAGTITSSGPPPTQPGGVGPRVDARDIHASYVGRACNALRVEVDLLAEGVDHQAIPYEISVANTRGRRVVAMSRTVRGAIDLADGQESRLTRTIRLRRPLGTRTRVRVVLRAGGRADARTESVVPPRCRRSR
jgi:hypothetical protein